MRPFHSSRLVLALVALSAGPGVGPLSGQQPWSEPIRSALTDQNGDRIPDQLGELVTVEGIIISDPLVLSGNATLANFQDSTGGIVLFTRDTTALRGLVRGDSIRVRGRIDQYQGAEQLVVEELELLGRTAVPEPHDVLVSDLLGEEYFGQLVRVAGRLDTRETGAALANVELTDRTGSIPVYISTRWLTDPHFVEHLNRGGQVEVVGIASQETLSDPPRDGYRIVPRAIEDFHFAAPPPYGLIAFIAMGVLGLVILWGSGRARQRAEELEGLTGQLKRSREEIQEREERFRSLVENAADTVSILDPESRILYQSPSVKRMLGWHAAELEGRLVIDLIHTEDRARFSEVLAELAAKSGESREVEFRIQSRDGSWRRVEVTATSRLHDPAVRGIVCNTRDMTQHKVLEQLVRNADRMEAVGRLAGGVAHDFNNVLTALRGHAELALEEIPKNAPFRHDLEEIIRSSERAAALTRQLLAFSRQQVLQPKVILPAVVLEGMLPMLRRLIGEDIELITEIGSEIGGVRADPVQLEQVIMNLVVNARDAMPDGGRMTLELEDDRIAPVIAAQYPYRVVPGPYVRLSVTDTGFGMDEEVLSHVFDPFFTTKGQGDGTGLGLATLYGIVKQSGGYVWASSEPGYGSRFDAYFPRVPVEEAMIESGGATREPMRGGDGETILLVEDEDAVRELARRVLEKNGYRVMEAQDPASALALADEEAGRIDLLFTDVVMPGMSGGELADRLRESRPELLTLYTSGYTEDEVVRRGVSAGEAEFMEKPFTPDQLLQRVQGMLSGLTRKHA